MLDTRTARRAMTPPMRASIAKAQAALEASSLTGSAYWSAECMIDRARQCETDAGAADWLRSVREVLPAA